MTEISEKEVRAVADVLLGRVNAPEQEIYRAARDALSAAARVRAGADAGGPVGGMPERIRVWKNEPNGEFVASFPGDLYIDENVEYVRADLAHPAPQPSGTVGALADALRGLLKAYENAFDWTAELPPETAEAERIANEVLEALTSSKPEQEQSEEHRYAKRLLIALMEKHFPDRSPEWAPLPDLMGVLTQIDNITTGLVRTTPPTAGGGDE